MKSAYDKSHYYGLTTDLDARLKKHNGGKVRYTKAKRPWKIIYFEEFSLKAEDYRRELHFKSYSGYKFAESIRRSAREAEWDGLENRYPLYADRGFESLLLR